MPTPTFDGDNLLVILPAAEPAIDVQVDLYSEWKVWALLSTNHKYPDAFETSGGRPTDPGETESRNFFFKNDVGWRFRNAEEDAQLVFAGNLFLADITKGLFVPTLGGFTVTNRIKFSSLAFEKQGGPLTAAQILQLDRAEFIYKVFLNRAVTTDIGGGVKRIDFYDDDQASIIDSVTISADGLIRTNP